MRRALGLILSAHQTEASWDRYQANVAEARARVGPGAPVVDWVPTWFNHAGFLAAMADRVGAALGEVPGAARAAARLVFTAHSVPVAMAAGSPYVAQLRVGARGRRAPRPRAMVARVPEPQRPAANPGSSPTWAT